jgi:hypothetical protein
VRNVYLACTYRTDESTKTGGLAAGRVSPNVSRASLEATRDQGTGPVDGKLSGEGFACVDENR